MIVLGDVNRLHVRVDIDENDLPYFSTERRGHRHAQGPAAGPLPAEVRLRRALRHPQAEPDRLQLRAGRYPRAPGHLRAARRPADRRLRRPADGRLPQGGPAIAGDAVGGDNASSLRGRGADQPSSSPFERAGSARDPRRAASLPSVEHSSQSGSELPPPVIIHPGGGSSALLRRLLRSAASFAGMTLNFTTCRLGRPPCRSRRGG